MWLFGDQSGSRHPRKEHVSRPSEKLFVSRRRGRLRGELLEERSLLAVDIMTDDHAWHEEFDRDGNEYHVLPEPTGEELLLLETGGIDGTSDVVAAFAGLAPLSDTFRLHSNATARHTIYLDFDGHVTRGTSWNSGFNSGQDIVTPAYDFDGVTASFSTAELERIQYIWQRVAEDFSPFDVNVTTELPATDRLIKSGTSDDAWGVRVVIGGSSSDWYGTGAGGVAYRGSFTWSSDTPVFVFEANLGNGAEKYTAEAISHETGHALGLAHDGTSTATYYAGHGSGDTGWAPIMGNSYSKNLTHWSRGEYAGATNAEDDLAIITGGNGFGYRVDDHANGDSGASLLSIANASVTGIGIIERNTDIDVFSFMTSSGNIQLNINPFVRGPNLDILAELYDASHNLIVASNPLTLLNATISTSVSAGLYYLRISGVGVGDPMNGGYSDYGSIGQYIVTGTVVPTGDTYISIQENLSSVVEGNSGSTPIEFTVTRGGDVAGASQVEYVVSGGTASASDFLGGVLPQGIVSFSAGETSKTVRFEIVADAMVEPDENFVLTLSNPSIGVQVVGSDPEVTIVNDDTLAAPSILVSPTSGLVTKESGSTASFTVVLATQPVSDVVILVTSLDITEGTVDKGQLTFTPTTWNTPQTVTIRGVDDIDRDGTVGYSVQLAIAPTSDSAYGLINTVSVSVTNQDNEKAAKPGGKGGPRSGPTGENGTIPEGQGDARPACHDDRSFQPTCPPHGPSLADTDSEICVSGDLSQRIRDIVLAALDLIDLTHCAGRN